MHTNIIKLITFFSNKNKNIKTQPLSIALTDSSIYLLLPSLYMTPKLNKNKINK